MANYKSIYTGEQIDNAIGTLQGKGLEDVIGLVNRNSDGTFSAESINDKADITTTVTGIDYDSTNKKITKTINNTTSDVITITTLKNELGSMPASDVYDWAKASTKPTYTAAEVSAVSLSSVGNASGVVPLNSSSKIDATYLPSYVDDVLEYSNIENFPATGETGKIYVDTTTNKTYRWSGSTYVEISPGTVVTVNQVLSTGTKVATIGVNGTNYDIYAPTGGSGGGGGIDTEVDPIFTASPAYGITTADIERWNTGGSGGGSGTITNVTAGTGLSGGGSSGSITLNHANSITAQTTQAVYPIKIDAQGHITEYGTAITIPDVSGKIDTAGTGLSKTGTTLNHTNSITAQSTLALYPITIDAQGHIASYGSAITIPAGFVSTITTTAGTHTPITSQTGTVTFNVPTNTSHLTNDSDFLTAEYSENSTTTNPLDADLLQGHAASYFATAASPTITGTATIAAASITGNISVGGNVTVAAGTNYTTAKVRNITVSTAAPTSSAGGNGDIWIVYEA